MKKRKLGEIEVSAVGMGCMAFSHGYGKIPPEQYSIEAIQMAYEHGCTFFDTAEIYSPNLSGIGHNERIVGKALHDVRENVVVGTKLFLNTSEVQRDGSVYGAVRRHLEGSLERLQTDYADLYYLHRMAGGVRIEDVAEAMGQLMEEGLIRGWGLSLTGRSRLRRFLPFRISILWWSGIWKALSFPIVWSMTLELFLSPPLQADCCPEKLQ